LLFYSIAMECYFGTHQTPDSRPENGARLVCFSIPAAGITFKAPFRGDEELHTEYASLLTLLEFIELNQKIFAGKQLKIYGDNLELIKQIQNSTCRHEFSDLLRQVLKYKSKYKYSLGWIPKDQNPSTSFLFD